MDAESMAAMANEALDPELEACLAPSAVGQVLRHPLVYAVPYVPIPGLYNKMLAEKKAALEAAEKAGSWQTYIWLHERPHRMNALASICHLWEHEDPDFWSLFGAVWIDSENLWQAIEFIGDTLTDPEVSRQMMVDRERLTFATFPDEIRVFRGASEWNVNGWSWTTSYHKARWFQHRQGDGKMIAALVRRENVHAWITQRGESEIIVNPDDVYSRMEVAPGRDPLLDLVTPGFQLPKQSEHGPWHWERVAWLGDCLAVKTPGADTEVVRMFAYLHDCKRVAEMGDPDHGPRAAAYVQRLALDGKLDATDKQLRLLVEACDGHSRGGRTSDPTIGVCWDADRLDLIRVGKIPNRKFFSTEAAKRLQWSI